CLPHLVAGRLARSVQGSLALAAPLLQALLADFHGVSPCLPQPLGVLGGLGLRLRDGLAGVFHRAFCQGAAFGQHRRQRPLHQELITKDKHNKEQSRRNGAHQQLLELLDGILHGDTTASSERMWSFWTSYEVGAPCSTPPTETC